VVTANNIRWLMQRLYLAAPNMAPLQTIKAFTNLKTLPPANTAVFSSVGYFPERLKSTIKPAEPASRNMELKEGSSKLNEVVVTGVSRATELRSNPVPIVVLSKKDIDQHVNNNIIDAIVKASRCYGGYYRAKYLQTLYPWVGV
jgi:iron complex outermembrane receptor protein